MNLTESLRIALGGLLANKLRSALTMLGIIIGVGAVIALLSVGQGLEYYVTGQFQGLGSNLLFVMPGALEEVQGHGRTTRIVGLTYGDARAIADPLNVSGVVDVAPELTRNALAVYSSEETRSSISGVTPEYADVRNFHAVEGEFITQEAMNGRSRVAVIGQTVVEDLFPPDVYPIGQVIKLNQMPFRVIGIMEEKGGSMGFDQDNVVLVPLSTAATRLFEGRSISGDYSLSMISVQVVNEDSIEVAREQITQLLRARHKIQFQNEDDFTVLSQEDFIEVFGDIMRVLTIVLGAIAAISLVVGGIGIMNIMLVSVTERTREIGIRKAVGAKRRDILMQFLIEAIMLSLVGGAFGIMLGFIGSGAIAQFVPDLTPKVTLGAILLATGFSAAVGLFFGIYPATSAARLNPIDALRYE
jgi:putative ABC transport system permease protein